MAKYSNGMQIGFVMLGRLATRKLTSAARHAFLSLDVLLDGRAKNFWNLQCVCPLFAVVAEAFREKDCERSFCHTFLTSVIMDELEKKAFYGVCFVVGVWLVGVQFLHASIFD